MALRLPIAEDKGVLLNYEAAVAGGIPVIKALRESLTGNTVSRVYGIMNGTCNYILTSMGKEGISFEDCLADAQRLGYAEADPTFDIEGNDTAHKLAILTSLAFGTAIAADDIYLEGISNISIADINAADDLGYRIKLLGVALRPKAASNSVFIRPWCRLIPSSRRSMVSPMRWRLKPIFSANCFCPAPAPAALRRRPPSLAILPILRRAARASSMGLSSAPLSKRWRPTSAPEMRAHEGGYFIRLTVHDRAGVFAAIAKRMADNDISLESIVQRQSANDQPEATKTVILVTHETTEAAVKKALEGIVKDGHATDKPQMIRIERAGICKTRLCRLID